MQFRSYGRWGALLFVAFFALLNAWEENSRWFTTHYLARMTAQQLTIDGDEPVILSSLRSHPTFASTLSWWHSNWVGLFLYWRPVTCLLYWIEYQVFTPVRFDLWQAALIAFHLIFVCVFAAFVYRVTRRFDVALLSVLLFAASPSLWKAIGAEPIINVLPWPSAVSGCNVADEFWKDQPEAWESAALLGGILLALNKRWTAALIVSAVAICMKENGWIAFGISGALLLRGARADKALRSPLIAYAATALILVALRWSAGREVFFGAHPHSNGGWPTRLFDNIAGTVFEQMRAGRAVQIVTGAIITLELLALRLRPVPRLLAILATFASAAFILAAVEQTDAATAGCLMLLPAGDLGIVMKGAVLILFAWQIISARQNRAAALWLIGMLVASALPTALTLQPSMHMMYLPYAFQAAIIALATCLLADRIRVHAAQYVSARKKAAPDETKRDNLDPALDSP